jgi:hypothetical protein
MRNKVSEIVTSTFAGLIILTSIIPASACPENGSNPRAPFSIFLEFGAFSAQGVDLSLGEDDNEEPIQLAINFNGYSGDPDHKIEVCERVAEDFAPFNVNVTWNVPINAMTRVRNGDAFMVVIGLTQQQLGSIIRGSQVRGSSDLGLRVGFVAGFYDTDGNGAAEPVSPKGLAQTASHEVGHLVSKWWSPDLYFYHRGASIQDPNAASAIMGTPYSDRPDLWDKGRYLNGMYAEEIGLLAPALGVIDLRLDPYGNSRDQAFRIPLVKQGPPRVLQAWGLVDMNADSRPSCWAYGDPSCPWRNFRYDMFDFFKFEARKGITGFTVEAATIGRTTPSDPSRGYAYAANLIADLELHRFDGNTWQKVSVTPSYHKDGSATLSFNPTLMKIYELYAVGVKSKGGYGRIGRYRLTISGSDVREAS